MRTLLISAILLIALMGCTKKLTMDELELKFGVLTEHTPEAGFIHFMTVDSIQIDCIRTPEGTFQVLTTTQR